MDVFLSQFYAFMSGCFLVLAVESFYSWLHKLFYYKSLPKSLKAKNDQFNVSKKVLKIVDETYFDLIQTASSKYLVDRGPERILSSDEQSKYIEKYVYIYYDDFTDEISDGKLDWNNENTRLFFELMSERFGITNRALLRTLLYLRHEIDYFNYRDSLLMHAPTSRLQLLKKTIVYNVTNEEEPVSKYKIKRMLCELGFGLPYVPMERALDDARLSLEVDRFDKDFTNKIERVKESSEDRLFRTSWEETVRDAFSEGINISKEDYIIVDKEDCRRPSRIDRYFRKHLKYALLDHFDGECGDCAAKEGLQLDHFWCAKKDGGNFAMRSKTGFYVNNCLPLCGSCNASKGAKHVYEYFDANKVQKLLKRSHEFDIFLNQKLRGFSDDHFNVVPFDSFEREETEDADIKKAS